MPVSIDLRKDSLFLDGLKEGQRNGEIKGILEVKFPSHIDEIMSIINKIGLIHKFDNIKALVLKTESAGELMYALNNIARD